MEGLKAKSVVSQSLSDGPPFLFLHLNGGVFHFKFWSIYGTYRGGSGSDFVTLGATATDMLFAALTADGDDLFIIDPGTDVDYLYIDFGLGNDTLDNQLGDPLPFDHKFINL